MYETLQNCGALNCTHIECDIGRLEENEFVLVEIYSRVSQSTVHFFLNFIFGAISLSFSCG